MPTQTIPMRLVGGHVILQLDGVKTFLDTGSQVSFGNVPSLRLLGREYPIQPNLLGKVSIAQLRDGLRWSTPVPPTFDFDALLGLDFLAGRHLELDWSGERLTVTGHGRPARALHEVPMLPKAAIHVNGRRLDGAMDTGAWRSYLLPEAAAGLPKVGTFTDYNPIFGHLTAELVRAETRFLGHAATVDVGVATPALEQVIRFMGADILIGNDLLTGPQRLSMEIGATNPGCGQRRG